MSVRPPSPNGDGSSAAREPARAESGPGANQDRAAQDRVQDPAAERGPDGAEQDCGPYRSTRQRVPSHLRRYVVEQRYDEYNAVDQAVWRFVLTQIYDTLRHTAHPAYEEGLARTGIALDHIPRVDEMDERLQRYGWGAVCVDGFIPPRAFVEFQALGILPIAADIRSKRHLVYTPAPDIIHEAAGHAPILPDPTYAAYLKRIGHVGAMAFSSPEDARVYDAIHHLSEIKERSDATEEDVARAERTFAEALESVTRVTEATRMSRLYWWTAEYGLVGTPQDYKLFGAGLLSSLGESHSCHGPDVRKIPLSVECLEVGYDITRAQPQLFVARDFEHLEEVLSDAERTLVARRGGADGLREAERSGEVATLTLGTPELASSTASTSEASPRGSPKPLAVIGRVLGSNGGLRLTRVQLGGPVALARDGHIVRILPELRARTTGPAAELLASPAWTLPRGEVPPLGSLVRFELGGERLQGTLERAGPDDEDRLRWLCLEEALLGDEPLPSPTLLVAGAVLGARAGAVDPTYYAGSLFPDRLVPEPRHLDAGERALLTLYEQAVELTRDGWGARAAQTLTELHVRLQQDFPNEWLLRWNLLEALTRFAPHHAAREDLTRELTRLERRFAGAEPIALGLRHLARQARGR